MYVIKLKKYKVAYQENAEYNFISCCMFIPTNMIIYNLSFISMFEQWTHFVYLTFFSTDFNERERTDDGGGKYGPSKLYDNNRIDDADHRHHRPRQDIDETNYHRENHQRDNFLGIYYSFMWILWLLYCCYTHALTSRLFLTKKQTFLSRSF